MTTGNREELRNKPFQLTELFFLGVLFSAILGGVTNAINVTVSPIYFINILRWPAEADVFRMGIAQGIFEGLLFGVFFSLIFTA